MLVSLVLAVAGLLIVSIKVLLLIFAGVLVGVLLNGLSQFIASHTPLSYRFSYVAVLLVIVAVVGAAGYYWGSQVASQITTFASQADSAMEHVEQQAEKAGWGQLYQQVRSQFQQMMNDGDGIIPQVMSVASTLAWGVTAIVVVLFVGLYVSYDPHLYRSGLLKLVPLDHRGHAGEVMQAFRLTLMQWIIGRLISMSIVGVTTGIALWWLGVPLPIFLGVLAALLTFVPNIGPILAAVPQALLAFQVSPATVWYVIVFNVAMQAAESYLITPMVLQYEVTLPPALTIFAQLLMAVLIGPIGMVMAAPLTAAVMVLVQKLYIHETLGDPKPGRLVEQT